MTQKSEVRRSLRAALETAKGPDSIFPRIKGLFDSITAGFQPEFSDSELRFLFTKCICNWHFDTLTALQNIYDHRLADLDFRDDDDKIEPSHLPEKILEAVFVKTWAPVFDSETFRSERTNGLIYALGEALSLSSYGTNVAEANRQLAAALVFAKKTSDISPPMPYHTFRTQSHIRDMSRQYDKDYDLGEILLEWKYAEIEFYISLDGIYKNGVEEFSATIRKHAELRSELLEQIKTRGGATGIDDIEAAKAQILQESEAYINRTIAHLTEQTPQGEPVISPVNDREDRYFVLKFGDRSLQDFSDEFCAAR